MNEFDQEPLLEVTEALIESGGSDLLDCLQCGTCSGVCPYALVRPHSVRRIIHQAALGLEGFEPLSWLCLTCRMCIDRCPQQIDLTAVMQSMRAVAADAGGLPPGVSAAVGSLSAAGNPWGGNQEDRAKWSEGLSLENTSESPDLTYFNCCTSAYDPRARKLAVAAVSLLDQIGLSVRTLGNNEVCCGDLAFRAGRADLAEQLAEKNLEFLKDSQENQPQTVVTSSPHCRQAFADWYEDLASKKVDGKHVTEILFGALEDERLTFKGSFEKKVAYHDPCYLGRYAEVYEPPRKLLEAVPGLDLVEFRRNRQNALCCGGGGSGAFRETPQEERHALLRIDEALEAGAEVIVTACPLCLLMLEDACRVKGIEEKIKVLDICEVLFQASSPEES